MGLFAWLFRGSAEPNQRLERMMAALARHNEPSARKVFFRQLLGSSLRVASPGSIDFNRLRPGAAVSDGSTKIPFAGR
ncbi:MAG: hypothetical protein PHU21_14895 [Elusimicrobia bacterium]|nr:hypothetical protein [Elusimicrobiota bacterium]